MSIPILVVDDNALNAKLLCTILTREGYTVRTATDAESALRILGEFGARLILTDVQMPGIDGLELTRILKADPAYAGVSIVAVTANAMKEDKELAKAAGCDGYVTKPIDLDSLLDEVARHVER